MRIAITTLGCKINQYETDLMRQDFVSQGNIIVPFDAEADVYVVNTCTVTAKSDYQCRQAIRSAVRRGKDAKVVVTGCYASTRPEEIRKIRGVDLVIGNADKAAISEQIMKTTAVTNQAVLVVPTSPIKSITGRTRGFLKIQDGCNNRCSYCVVPLARGGSRSADPRQVMDEFERLVQAGCSEIVLTGIHIGTYGADLENGPDLTGLIRTMVNKRSGSRLRLSSIEPKEITEGMIDLLGNGLCRHLHIPLQSGDDAVLASMNRDYDALFYRELLEHIAQSVPGAALGADVIVGYPGEGDVEFQRTVDLVEESPLTHLHVFSYSPRPGTPAATMKAQVSEQMKKQRSETLRMLGRRKNTNFRKKWTGSELKVVVEDKIDAYTGLYTGLTDNYIRVCISGAKKEHISREIVVRITQASEGLTFSEIL
ncbi:MAG TPA: tRNA (N(6)-L-threonylcarbamoyladenosine(37)-C(2))-methylthiotransferase MtaB [Nitrospirota bacterium]|nr:tRNA (N(6)-L-threonylcarbamoyladenosine(37)-C(2))-methylthiotransferase MtaB [Nitrospirota bacterium]